MTKCPVCGYVEVAPTKMVTNVMSKYVRADDPTIVVTMNSSEESLETKAKEDSDPITWIRLDVYEKTKNKKPTVSGPPVNPTIVGSPSPAFLASTGAVDSTNANAEAARKASAV
jgi:hypothetical protein